MIENISGSPNCCIIKVSQMYHKFIIRILHTSRQTNGIRSQAPRAFHPSYASMIHRDKIFRNPIIDDVLCQLSLLAAIGDSVLIIGA